MKNNFEKPGDFNSIALKLRMQRYDKETVNKLKEDAAKFEKEKNKKRKAAIKIQKNFRGFSLRKKFSEIMEEINTNIIIDYVRAKRKERIRSNPEIIISYYLNRYIQRKRDFKRMILFDYLNFCVNFIRKIYIGYKFRIKFIPRLNIYRASLSKISDIVNSFKIRSILRSKKFQDMLVEISNIKSCLLTLMSDVRNSDKTEKLKRDFMKRLPRLQRNFYEEFYTLKSSRKWLYYPKVNKSWIHSYMNILLTVNLQAVSIFDENPKTPSKSPRKEYEQQNSNNYLNLVDQKDQSVINNSNQSPLVEKVTKQKFIQIQESVNENPLEEDKNEVNIDNLQDNQIKYVEVNSDKNEGAINYNSDDKPEELETNNNALNYDDRPIKVNPQKLYDYYKMMAEYPDEGQDNRTEDKNFEKSSKKKKIEKIRRKTPKYDARKAIEEAKNINTQGISSGHHKDRDNFREFLRKIKQDSNSNTKLDEKINDNDLNNIEDLKKSSHKDEIFTKSTKKNKKKEIKDRFLTEGELMENLALSDEFLLTNAPKNEEKTRRIKNVSNEINLRRKLHELERSPPPRV